MTKFETWCDPYLPDVLTAEPPSDISQSSNVSGGGVELGETWRTTEARNRL